MASIGLLIAITINAGGFIGNWLNNPELNKYTLMIGLAIIAMLPYELAEPFLISANKSNHFSVLNALAAISYFVIVLSSLLMNKSLGFIFTSITALYVTQFSVLFIMMLRYSKNSSGGEDKRVTLKQVINYCLPISLQLLVGKMSGMLDRYIISSNFTPAQYAVYSRGATQLPIIEILPYSMSNVLFPKYSSYQESGKLKELFELWQKAMMKVAFLVYPVFAFFCVYSYDFIVIIYTDEYV